MLHGQGFDPAGLLLTTGFAPGLGLCFATAVGLTLSPNGGLLAAAK
jgi:hypothetical protein